MVTLTIDLASGKTEKTIIAQHIEEEFVGARGTNTKLFSDMTEGIVDPLSEKNPIIFGTGPLTGTPFPMGGRFEVTTKSPQTGTIFTSSCGGWFGVLLKKSGIDTLIVTGAAETPSYISIEEGNIEIANAGHLWGQEKKYVKEWLREKYGRDISILLIGRAGENRILFSNIENDGRYLGRGGLGAVLGSKKIKAIIVKGKGKIPIADKEGFSFISYECRKWLSANPVTSKGLPEFGTGVLLNYMREAGLSSTNNFRFPAPGESSKIAGEMVTAQILQGKRACPFCPVACGRVNKEGEGPEYESLWALGVNLAIYDLEKVVYLNNLCNEAGLDTITTGTTIGMAIELTETGKGSFHIKSGDFEKIKETIANIAEKKDIGEILALGTKKLGEIYSAKEIAPQVKGLELPAYDPRGAYGHALGYATSNRGGCHLQGYLIGAEVLGIPKLLDRHSIQGKASLLALYQNVSAFMDTLVMCRFSSFAIPHDYYARIASTVTGRKITWEDSIRTGERIWNLEKMINLREGVEEDRLPGRFHDVPLEELLKEYYEIRHWDRSGYPKRTTLDGLGLV